MAGSVQNHPGNNTKSKGSNTLPWATPEATGEETNDTLNAKTF